MARHPVARWAARLFAIPVAVVAVVFALMNRQAMTLELWPLPFTLEAPVFLVVYLALLAGFLIGGLTAWLSGGGARRRARRMAAERERLRRELEDARQRSVDLPPPAIPAEAG